MAPLKTILNSLAPSCTIKVTDILRVDFSAPSILLLKALRRKMANKSLNMLIKWVKMDKKFKI